MYATYIMIASLPVWVMHACAVLPAPICTLRHDNTWTAYMRMKCVPSGLDKQCCQDQVMARLHGRKLTMMYAKGPGCLQVL